MDYSVEIDPFFVWNEYRYLEDDFLKSVRYLPLVPEHYDVWSAHFADLLIRIGSVFDSFLKRAIFCESSDDIENIDNYRSKYSDNKINIIDYFDVFEPTYKLSSKVVYELHESESIEPFSNWNETYTRLDWWNAYTSLKHDRFVNREAATLEAILNALGGLFLLNVLNPETALFLVDYNVTKCVFDKSDVKKIIVGNKQTALPVYVKTKLFGYVYEPGGPQYPEEYIRTVLSPSYPGYG
ncbi:hypothetical protein SAMN04488587_0418 [Methanococcoides vulcani]|uniref:Uncharacterized protein n=1 Tax=Methanococcoides vulcani TaxID=1353158 RepID=A0A1H9YBY8_9EURY|nr:hypothetical protein [Methanococcoides vulcani]SES66358.1 hypothetical protein SAMN04488587_0418 [Methanococcoides vulcani]